MLQATEATERTILSVIEERPNLYLGLGIAMVVAGVAAIVLPWLATLAAEALLGAILVVGGVAAGVHGVSARRGNGVALHLVGAALYVVVGALLLLFPVAGVVALTLVIGAFFLAEGVLRLVQAVRLRGRPGVGWLAAGGVLALVLAVLILAAWPFSAAWTLGILLGIDLVFGGWWLISLARTARRRQAPAGGEPGPAAG